MAPAGSTTIASSLYICKIVEQIFPSGTKCISSIASLQNAKVTSPILLTAAPSTNLSILANSTGCFACKAANILGAPSGSSPTTFVWGDTSLKYVPTPALNPPPPTGIKI